MFSQTMDYALRAAVYLASNPPRHCATKQIARATNIPAAYLAKVLKTLVQARVLQSQRGLGGGIALVKPPDELSMLEVVNAVDPLRRRGPPPTNTPSTIRTFASCTST